jgi:hypothetical protein
MTADQPAKYLLQNLPGQSAVQLDLDMMKIKQVLILIG